MAALKRRLPDGNLTMMDEREITCELVDERELDSRYLSGRLTDDEASAFEAHYFGCDRYWALVRGGMGIRAAMSGEAATTPPSSYLVTGRGGGRWRWRRASVWQR